MADPAPEVIYLDPVCPACNHVERFWWDQEEDAGCDCTLKATQYIRADLWDDYTEEQKLRAELIWEEQELKIYTQIEEIKRLKTELDRLKADIETPHERRGFS